MRSTIVQQVSFVERRQYHFTLNNPTIDQILVPLAANRSIIRFDMVRILLFSFSPSSCLFSKEIPGEMVLLLRSTQFVSCGRPQHPFVFSRKRNKRSLNTFRGTSPDDEAGKKRARLFQANTSDNIVNPSQRSLGFT
ncbi:hypothetical protein TNCV_1736511 [Trichonephila clavipes]|nr:hypothetical protein TNCV_1736511 [Trichonephila clavipes]